MPAAKKPATRRSTRSRASASSSSPISRKEVEKATAQFEKALEQASTALQTLGQDLGKSAVGAYREVEKALRTLRRDAQRTNKSLLKDLDKLAAAMPGPVGRSTSRSTTSRRTASKSPARRTAAGKSTTRRASA